MYIKLNMIFIVIKYLDKFQKACSFSVHQIIMECIRTFVGVEKPVRGEKSNLNKTIYLKALSQYAHKHFTSFSIGHETVTLHVRVRTCMSAVEFQERILLERKLIWKL